MCLSAVVQHIAYMLHAIAQAILLLCMCNVRYGIAYRLMTKKLLHIRFKTLRLDSGDIMISRVEFLPCNCLIN